MLVSKIADRIYNIYKDAIIGLLLDYKNTDSEDIIISKKDIDKIQKLMSYEYKDLPGYEKNKYEIEADLLIRLFKEEI